MSGPWLPVPALSDGAFLAMRRRAIFDCFKWDPQVEDVGTVARVPLVLTAAAWRQLTALGEALARETLAMEAELLARPDLMRHLGLPRRASAVLARARADGASRGIARLVRFDFHHTPDGWRISEANSDVPGGLNEAAGFPLLMAPHYPAATTIGDPVDAYLDALLSGSAASKGSARIALLHATAYSDDHQMMAFIARRLRDRGASPMLVSPSHVRWERGRAFVDGGAWQGEADALLRFFPADWLIDLPSSTWAPFFVGGRTPISNPATALLTQTKRLPLTWHALETPVPTWRALLPETRDPRDVPWRESEEWVLKPSLGRVGEDVAIRGIISPTDWNRVQKDCARHPDRWIAQRRFDASPVELAGQATYPCIGVYTVDQRVVGAYGRMAPRALIDARAVDTAVLVERSVAA